MVNIKPLVSVVRSFRVAYCFGAFAAFLGGVAVYAFFRNLDNIVLFRYFPKPSFLPTPHIPLGTDNPWGYVFVFNLPHGLWCLSGLLVIRAIWLTDTKWRAVYGGAFVAAASSIEVSQLSENLPGTFDVLDLASYGIAAFSESIMYNTFVKRRIV